MTAAPSAGLNRFDAVVGGVIVAIISLIVLVIALGDHVDRKALRDQTEAARQTAIAVLQPSPMPTASFTVLESVGALPRAAADAPALAYLAGETDTGLIVDGTRWIDGVAAVSANPDGTQIAYLATDRLAVVIVDTPTGARRAYPCPTPCAAIAWRPGAAMIAVARAVTADSDSVRLWLLDLADGESRPLLADALTTGERAVWSASGDRVLLASPAADAALLYDYGLRDTFTHDAAAGVTGVFAPDGERIVFADCGDPGCRVLFAGALAGKSRAARGEVGEFVPTITALAWPTGSPHPIMARADALVWGDLETGALTIIQPAAPGVTYTDLVPTPDGDQIAVTRMEDGSPAIWVYDRTADTFTAAAPGQFPVWIAAPSAN